jgi:NAD(P)-dependent dehydrogenase (short-subunit alcohol dehydrogenase family)
MASSEWSAVPAPGTRVLLTGAAGGLGRARRVAALAEIVGPVLYLLSPAAGYMTGQALRLDGGAGLGQAGLYR